MKRIGIAAVFFALLFPAVHSVQAVDVAGSKPAGKSKVVMVDRNNDGNVDGIDVYNDDGKVVRRGYDDNGDRVMERWQSYDPNTGMPNVVESDTNGELR